MTALTTSTNGSKTSQGPKSVSGRLGKLCTRLAENENEIEKAQQVRYKVFCEELNASPATRNLINQRDEDRYDQHCDHLIMLDTSDHPATNIVGTQRFHVGDGTTPLTDFYSSGEFDVAGLLKRHPEKRFMELGRSCILPEYRSLRTMELLWHGTWQYALKNRADVMFGCASFYTTDPEEIAGELGFLSQIRVDEAWKVSSSRSDRIELDEYRCRSNDLKSIVRKLPPLLKGYLRLGAGFSDVAVPDNEFGTIDILVVLPLASINPRYIAHFGADTLRHDR